MPVAGAVVRFDRQDAAANSRHPRALANRRGDITDMLQDAPQNVESNAPSPNGR